ncbi:MAG TPA: glycosyltransferase family 4 protein [Candidatus Brachybacterium intestinipullorum]|uniref:Glycosyltransferase family 4 protein n=1 Tax=Candidatus Brachybacterium intestinipullorum TaxID=2838512 RepID=A0A9D2PXV0_9MICO|nr:glycosyltransferase family 4 protein [Candidatus Brachybacterium intestinipullorum]
MPDRAALTQRAIVAGARAARHLPGAVGGMGVYFWAQHRLAEDPRSAPWREDVDVLLGHADAALGRGRVDAALRWFDKALRLCFDGSLHQAGSSPLAADPEGFLRAVRMSRTGRIMLPEDPPMPREPVRPAPRERGDGPARLLVIAQENWTFIRPLLDALEERYGVEVRTVDVDDLAAPGFADRDRILRARYDALQGGELLETPPELAEGFDWADVVLVEWAHHVLTWVTQLDRAPRRLAVRLHRFEAFTPFPLLTEASRIDHLLYVSPPVRTMLCRVAPAFAQVPAQQVGNLLTRGLGPEPGAESDAERDPHLIVQVGWLREIKDVMFSLDVLERLRAHDDRYRLRLIGPALRADPSSDTPYQRRVRERLAAMDEGAVEILGRREDVPALLAEAGIVLSSSRHEGTHEAVMEGMAAGCAAVVRDWPETAAYGGAATIYDPRWVVADEDAAVERILELADPAVLAEASRAARAFAVQQRDPDRVLARYAEGLELGERR